MNHLNAAAAASKKVKKAMTPFHYVTGLIKEKNLNPNLFSLGEDKYTVKELTDRVQLFGKNDDGTWSIINSIGNKDNTEKVYKTEDEYNKWRNNADEYNAWLTADIRNEKARWYIDTQGKEKLQKAMEESQVGSGGKKSRRVKKSKRKRTRKSKTKKRRSQKIVGGDDRFTDQMKEDMKKKVEEINLFNETDYYYIVLEKNDTMLTKALVARNIYTCKYKLKPQLAIINRKFIINTLSKTDFMNSLRGYRDEEEMWDDIKEGDIIVQLKGQGMNWYKPSQDTWKRGLEDI
jgi:hypothetical protein